MLYAFFNRLLSLVLLVFILYVGMLLLTACEQECLVPLEPVSGLRNAPKMCVEFAPAALYILLLLNSVESSVSRELYANFCKECTIRNYLNIFLEQSNCPFSKLFAAPAAEG